MVSQVAATQLGAAHPDNPYFGTAARLSYLPQFDTGVPSVKSKSHAFRFVGGLKGTWNAWDFDTGITYSEGVRTTSRPKRSTASQERLLNPSLHEADKLRSVLTLLEEKELAYPSEGAVWMRTTEYGDDKDRVLMRSNGEMTYFAADIAYHRDKLERGYGRAIDVLGADHHGHVKRMLAAWDLLGGEEGTFELPIMQLVNLMEDGQRVQMSKRGGEFVTLDDLIDDIGVDAARFFLLQRSHDTTLDLDLKLARDRSQDNPVYYLQYAHARIASILRKAGSDTVDAATAADLAASPEQLHASARVLLKRLLEWPGEVLEAADRRAPHRITVYLHVLAQDFTAFYRDVKVVDPDDGGDEAFRLAMCVATRRVLARGLDLLGVEAPQEMHRDQEPPVP